MLTNKHLFEEIKPIEEEIEKLKTTDPTRAAELKVATLTVKLIHNLRTNMVAIMRHLNIELVKPARRGTGKDEEAES